MHSDIAQNDANSIERIIERAIDICEAGGDIWGYLDRIEDDAIVARVSWHLLEYAVRFRQGHPNKNAP